MAEQQVVTFSDKPISEKQKAKEFEEHERTYEGFIEWSKWTLIVTVGILIILYLVFVH